MLKFKCEVGADDQNNDLASRFLRSFLLNRFTNTKTTENPSKTHQGIFLMIISNPSPFRFMTPSLVHASSYSGCPQFSRVIIVSTCFCCMNSLDNHIPKTSKSNQGGWVSGRRIPKTCRDSRFWPGRPFFQNPPYVMAPRSRITIAVA